MAAYLGRYRGQTRLHTESDLRAAQATFAALDLASWAGRATDELAATGETGRPRSIPPRIRPGRTPTRVSSRSVSAGLTGGLPAVAVNTGATGHPSPVIMTVANSNTGYPTSTPITATARPGFHG
jgi:hypothetical protein